MLKRLLNTKAYLVGPMDKAKDRGEGWRTKLWPFLRSLGVIVMDPCNKPLLEGHHMSAKEDRDFADRRDKLILEQKFDEVKRSINIIRHTDLRMVDKSDFIIVHLDWSIPMCGTFEEIYIANLQQKPIIIHCEQGKEGMAPWMFDVCPHSMWFESWEEVQQYLLHIHQDADIDYLNRWVFFDLNEQIKQNVETFLLSKESVVN